MAQSSLNTGDLDKRITLYKPVYGGGAQFGSATFDEARYENTSQDEIVGWTPVATVWAAILPKDGKEIGEAGRIVALTGIPIKIRYRRGLDKRMRVVYRTRWFEVQAIVDPLERHESLLLDCLEVE